MNSAFIRFAKNHRNVEMLFNYMNDGLMLTNHRHEIIAVNSAFQRITGYTLKDVEGMNPSVLKSGKTPKHVYHEMWDSISRSGTWTGELLNERKDGTLFWSFITITKVEQPRPEDSYCIGIMRDISERKWQEEQMKYNASHDTLTKLPNRVLFKEKLEEALRTASENGEKVAVLFLDLDRFKKINDSYGHQAGDELLMKMSQRIQSVIGEKGLVSRFGGDEFTIFLPAVNEAATEHVISALFAAFEKPIIVHEKELYISMSIGACFFPEHGEDVETLLKNADSAMYRTKEEGRNHYQRYEQGMNETFAEELSLETELLKAIRQQELEVYYQLQVDIEKRIPFGIEALIRWNHPLKDVLSPAIFLPLAEEMGVMADIDEWVLNEACQQTRRWHREGFGELIVSVNVSREFFKRPDFVSRVEQALARAELDPAYLCLEITEKTAILQDEDIRAKLNQLKQKGVGVSLDDFGTGYSSLSQLRMFPIDTLKIDQSFIRGQVSPENQAIVKLIIGMANSLNVSVICEGIETEEQLSLIRNEGCYKAQGYLFSRPIPADECKGVMERLIQSFT
ncbi:EAL domain-containing protein [Alkalihalobacillus oceani]|uniref:putative bifunctional diguanylate cyclase/phosphodiesterase n=1 Tax=Halalkalibacter oceani TaxID=1653776 RepID=UPI0020411884|nr:EAL domain-containing protein [Halalkalibacter oceani]MCM3760133.1 EAL domain-containing protein [Halalkalibacter oceani]